MPCASDCVRIAFRLLALLALGLALARAESPAPLPVVDVRALGATGDGTVHPVTEWIGKDQRYRNLKALKEDHPFVDDPAKWSTDEAAFARALLSLPAAGGTVRFPAGHYVSARFPWRIERDHVRLVGDGAAQTILSGGTGVAQCLQLAGYRHVGWGQAHGLTAESGAPDTTELQLRAAEDVAAFTVGQLVFVRGGANRYDQDFGEFNEITAIDAVRGVVTVRHPLARDYRLSRIAWAGELASDFKLPDRDDVAEATARVGEGYFLPGPRGVISVGGHLLTVVSATPEGRLQLRNHAASNGPAGTVLPAGTKLAKARGLVPLTKSTRGFRAEGLTFRGQRKAVNISNSYDSAFVDCVIERIPDPADEKGGGITIDGDDGRFVVFERCTVRAEPAWQMQFARSFGDAVFRDCRFVDAGVSFTEFCFRSRVERCELVLTGGPKLAHAVVLGKSCDGVSFVDNRVRSTGVKHVFDFGHDIVSYKDAGDALNEVRGNVVEVAGAERVFQVVQAHRFVVRDNTITGEFQHLGITPALGPAPAPPSPS